MKNKLKNNRTQSPIKKLLKDETKKNMSLRKGGKSSKLGLN